MEKYIAGIYVHCAISQKISIKKIIAIPTGIAMGFAIPHAIKQQK